MARQFSTAWNEDMVIYPFGVLTVLAGTRLHTKRRAPRTTKSNQLLGEPTCRENLDNIMADSLFDRSNRSLIGIILSSEARHHIFRSLSFIVGQSSRNLNDLQESVRSFFLNEVVKYGSRVMPLLLMSAWWLLHFTFESTMLVSLDIRANITRRGLWWSHECGN